MEKRAFQRLAFPINVFVELDPLERPATSLPGLPMRSRNISQAGICLETRAIEIEGVNMIAGSPSARENRLRMKIAIQQDQPPILAVGEVRWYDINRDDPLSLYQLGVEFLEMAPEDKERLSSFLKEISPKKPCLLTRLLDNFKSK